MPDVRRDFTECAERNIGIDETEKKGDAAWPEPILILQRVRPRGIIVELRRVTRFKRNDAQSRSKDPMVGSGSRRSDDSQKPGHSNQQTVLIIVPQSVVRSMVRSVG